MTRHPSAFSTSNGGYASAPHADAPAPAAVPDAWPAPPARPVSRLVIRFERPAPIKAPSYLRQWFVYRVTAKSERRYYHPNSLYGGFATPADALYWAIHHVPF